MTLPELSDVEYLEVPRKRRTGSVSKVLCWIWIEAEPDMSLGTVKVKFSNVLSVFPSCPWDLYSPMNRISPRFADGAGQPDAGQGAMPITRLTSSSPASAL